MFQNRRFETVKSDVLIKGLDQELEPEKKWEISFQSI